MMENSNHTASQDFDQYPLINIEEGLGRTMNNKKLFAKLLNSFISNTMENDLLTAFGDKNLKNALSAAHALKGVAANLSLLRLRHYIAWIEQELKTGGLEAAVFNGEEDGRLKDTIAGTVSRAREVITELTS
jgi:HPt (histidine-containing phosphotransfer) domain-containing protein